MADIEAIRARWERVTPGEWWNESGVIHCADGSGGAKHIAKVNAPYWDDARPGECDYNAEARGEAKADVRTLLAAYDAATAERDAAQARVRELEARRCASCAEWQEKFRGEVRHQCHSALYARDYCDPPETPPDHFCAAWKPRTEDDA